VDGIPNESYEDEDYGCRFGDPEFRIEGKRTFQKMDERETENGKPKSSTKRETENKETLLQMK